MSNESAFEKLMPILDKYDMGMRFRNLLLEKLNEIRKESSIEFAQWLSGLGYQQYDGNDRWISQEESGNKVFTTKELYQRFLLNHKI